MPTHASQIPSHERLARQPSPADRSIKMKRRDVIRLLAGPMLMWSSPVSAQRPPCR